MHYLTTEKSTPISLIEHAIDIESESLCCLAERWGGSDFHCCLRIKACRSPECIKLLKESEGKKHVCEHNTLKAREIANGVLSSASRHGHEHLCRLAGKWGATNWKMMIMNVSRNGNERLCRLAREWILNSNTMNGSYFNLMLSCGAMGGHEHICRLAKQWGADNYDWMLRFAALGRHERLSRLAVEWGATNVGINVIN